MKRAITILSVVLVLGVFMASECFGTEKARDSRCDARHRGLPVLHLSGTPYENGYQHGKAMKNRIAELVGLWKKNIEINYGMPADRFIRLFLDSTNYIPAIQKWTPDLLEEIKGISDGSGIDFDTLFAFQLVDEIWTTARLINMPHHCTSVGINNYKKEGGPNLIAQNIDITPFYHGFEILLHIKDKSSGSEKLITTFAGYLGANGLNKNTGITVNTLSDLKSSRCGLPVCCVTRGALDKNSFEEAVNFIKTIPHASGQNYILGSEKDIVSLECAADSVAVYWPDTTRNYTFHANRPLVNKSYHPSYLAYLEAVYGSVPESLSFSDGRFDAMKNKITNSPHINADTLKEVLAQKPVCNSNTFVSTIMEFKKNYNQLSIAPGKPDSTAFIVFRIYK